MYQQLIIECQKANSRVKDVAARCVHQQLASCCRQPGPGCSCRRRWRWRAPSISSRRGGIPGAGSGGGCGARPGRAPAHAAGAGAAVGRAQHCCSLERAGGALFGTFVPTAADSSKTLSILVPKYKRYRNLQIDTESRFAQVCAGRKRHSYAGLPAYTHVWHATSRAPDFKNCSDAVLRVAHEQGIKSTRSN